MSLAWHTAYLTSYAPQKSKDFPRLQSLTSPKPVAKAEKPSWQSVFAKVQAWGSKS